MYTSYYPTIMLQHLTLSNLMPINDLRNRFLLDFPVHIDNQLVQSFILIIVHFPKQESIEGQI